MSKNPAPEPSPHAQASSAADQAGAAEADRFFRFLNERTKELQATGLSEGRARMSALLEHRISRWPAEWGDELRFILYGDFRLPEEYLFFSDLGITIEAGRVNESIVTAALCVRKARMTVREKSIAGLVEAAKQINTLLGALAVADWGNSGCGWWSHVTHGTPSGTSLPFDKDEIEGVIAGLKKLRPDVGRKVRAAIYWIREPRHMVMEGYRSDTLRVYAGYWNAFECLVDAVCLLSPQPKSTKEEKERKINEFIARRGSKSTANEAIESYTLQVDQALQGSESRLSVNDIVQCSRLADPGFVAKASHALQICFRDRAEEYIIECFRAKPKEDRLYDIRNSINHGDIDAENSKELIRVEDRRTRLWFIVFGMLGLFVPIKRPLDPGGAKG